MAMRCAQRLHMDEMKIAREDAYWSQSLAAEAENVLSTRASKSKRSPGHAEKANESRCSDGGLDAAHVTGYEGVLPRLSTGWCREEMYLHCLRGNLGSHSYF
ncbi:hypothetical protein BGAL_0170g00110 [Botrytis galanthina]|uniref:Uncharacterized protein n=1 Tax=Botrytis galanthina TaxID=278940 RepID=A0A4S8QZF4_9HELO|nr:hypothetical protein BGAL_0170g00110 [Botrytis galanthina]